MWERVVREILLQVRHLVSPERHVLEIGYGDGQLSCYLCNEFDWQIVGL